MFLPPQVLPVTGSQCSHTVIGIHHKVDGRVEQGVEGTESTWVEITTGLVGVEFSLGIVWFSESVGMTWKIVAECG